MEANAWKSIDQWHKVILEFFPLQEDIKKLNDHLNVFFTSISISTEGMNMDWQLYLSTFVEIILEKYTFSSLIIYNL